jgi:hypothetical protein
MLAEFYYYMNNVRIINDFYIKSFSVKKYKDRINNLFESRNIDYDYSAHLNIIPFLDAESVQKND